MTGALAAVGGGDLGPAQVLEACQRISAHLTEDALIADAARAVLMLSRAAGCVLTFPAIDGARPRRVAFRSDGDDLVAVPADGPGPAMTGPRVEVAIAFDDAVFGQLEIWGVAEPGLVERVVVPVARQLAIGLRHASLYADLEGLVVREMQTSVEREEAMRALLEHLKRTQAEAAAAQRLAAVGTLAAGVAHEINTPVQFVSDSIHFVRESSRDVFGLVDSLIEVRRLAMAGGGAAELGPALAASEEAEQRADLSYAAEKVPEALERCLDGLGRVATIVRSLKEFAHPAQRDMAPVDLNRAITSTLTVARGEYRFVAEAVCELGDLPPVRCHVNDINQVVLNLVVNAAHAIGDVVAGTDRKGTITVRTRRDGAHVVIEVADSGTGIPEEIRDRIFEPFFTTKEVGKGSGQGLALAWAVVTEKHGGRLSVASTVGVGTTFCIWLPVAGSDAVSAATDL